MPSSVYTTLHFTHSYQQTSADNLPTARVRIPAGNTYGPHLTADYDKTDCRHFLSLSVWFQ